MRKCKRFEQKIMDKLEAMSDDEILRNERKLYKYSAFSVVGGLIISILLFMLFIFVLRL